MPAAHPNLAAALAYLRDHRNETTGEVAKRFGMKTATLQVAASRFRKREGVDSLPPKKVVPKTSLTVLPTPKAKLDEELTSLARTATRNALLALAKPDAFKHTSPKDIATVLGVLTDRYELLPAVDGKTGTGSTHSADKRLVDALLGKSLPGQDEEEDDDPLAVVRRDHA